jgi:hypothetical protein
MEKARRYFVFNKKDEVTKQFADSLLKLFFRTPMLLLHQLHFTKPPSFSCFLGPQSLSPSKAGQCLFLLQSGQYICKQNLSFLQRNSDRGFWNLHWQQVHFALSSFDVFCFLTMVRILRYVVGFGFELFLAYVFKVWWCRFVVGKVGKRKKSILYS